ncbi:hypothetical protein SAMN05421839_13920 [Halolactibacillus halophilus]|uniref:Uncharacterized protein n=1 Tax=Halolactibacillus halophilus TaxID=306540 RepID=A0A1I5S5B3_9BACI|nr:hypothetical protein [Halolactibacillus halophilus]GEM02777.1 hypothetical protein HHA03_23090 [Halolactibacillus halophilus]SFP65920.1 hypothetical protein SAMN05421839_13920 [Halolactibacillus halophilus]
MNRYQDLIDRMDKWEIGRLIVDRSGVLKLQRKSDDEIVDIARNSNIEVLNGNKFEKHSYETLSTVTDDTGWPAYAGLYTRVK